MKHYRGPLLIASLLITASVVFYVIQWELFHKVQDAMFYFLQDLAFLPIQVLLVALVVERVLARREKNRLLHKMNMVIGTFFSEVGIRLLGLMTGFVANAGEFKSALAIGKEWTVRDWKQALRAAAKAECRIDEERMDPAAMRDLLSGNRQFLTILLANPNLMEHERFTDLLWAVSHLQEELAARGSFDGLPLTDLQHLAGDVVRVYSLLTVEWLLYCRHLQTAYPYIFSIMVRTHPLQESPSPVVR